MLVEVLDFVADDVDDAGVEMDGLHLTVVYFDRDQLGNHIKVASSCQDGSLFPLAGAADAVATPIAGRIADRGHSHAATALAMGLVALAFPLTHIAHPGSGWALGLLVVAAIALDFGVAANLTLGQRAIFALGGEVRARLNGLYMAAFILGGARGSALGAWAYARGGWAWALGLAFALPVAALAYWTTEPPSE